MSHLIGKRLIQIQFLQKYILHNIHHVYTICTLVLVCNGVILGKHYKAAVTTILLLFTWLVNSFTNQTTPEVSRDGLIYGGTAKPLSITLPRPPMHFPHIHADRTASDVMNGMLKLTVAFAHRF